MLLRLSLFITLGLQVCVLVEGLYQLEVTVFGYNNPTGRCQGCGDAQRCCDDFKSTNCSEFLCDSFFVYCLRTIGSTGRGCSNFGNRTSNFNTDDGLLNFSQSRVLGLENPVILQGLTYAYTGVQIYIEVWDDDTHFNDPANPNDFVDVLLIDHELPIGQPSSRQNHSGNFKHVMMDLSITARCVKNFQGSDCSRCLPDFSVGIIPTVGGAVGGTIVFIIFFILIALLIAKCRNRRELDPNINVTLSVETKVNEGHDASMATVLGRQPWTLENDTMDRNASYASAMAQHTYDIVH